MGKMVSTIKGVRKDAYFEAVLNGEGSTEEKIQRLCSEVRYAGVLNKSIPRGRLARKTAPVGKPQSSPTEEVLPVAEAMEPPVDAKPFDPYAIHTTNVYKSDGANGLLVALETVADIAHLKSIISAQRIPVTDVDDIEDPKALRASIVDAVARRIADRKAAAS